MSIPTALQNNLKELEELQKPQTPVEAPAQEDPAPAQIEGNQSAQPVQEVPQPESPESQRSSVLGNTPEAPAQDVEFWRHKYNVINGKYQAETSRLRQELKEKERAATPESPPKPSEQPISSTEPVTDEIVADLISPNLIEEFGMDYWKTTLEAQRKLQAVPNEYQQISNEIAELKQKAEAEEHEREEARLQSYYELLKQQTPDWQTVNRSREWQDFLGEVEPLSGDTYEHLLRRAHQDRDPHRVSELFRLFKGRNSNAPRPATPSVNSQVVPTPGANTGAVGGGTLTFQDWNQQMLSLTSSGLSPAEMSQKHDSLIAAYTQGRVTGIPQDAGPPKPQFA